MQEKDVRYPKVDHSAIDIESSWTGYAVKLAKDRRLTEEIGLRSPLDCMLLNKYLAHGLLETSVYNDILFIYSSEAEIFRRFPVVGKWAINHYQSQASKRKKGLDYMESLTAGFIERNFQGDEDRRRARTIGLAVRDLVTKSTIRKNNFSKKEIIISPEVVSEWGNIWRPQLKN